MSDKDKDKEKQLRREAIIAALLDAYPVGAAYGVGSPAEMAQQPGPPLGAVLGAGYDALGNTARDAFGASEMMRQSGVYDPGPVVAAATLPLGTGAVASVPMYSGQPVLGQVPVRALKTTAKTHNKANAILGALAAQDKYEP